MDLSSALLPLPLKSNTWACETCVQVLLMALRLITRHRIQVDSYMCSNSLQALLGASPGTYTVRRAQPRSVVGFRMYVWANIDRRHPLLHIQLTRVRILTSPNRQYPMLSNGYSHCISTLRPVAHDSLAPSIILNPSLAVSAVTFTSASPLIAFTTSS